MAYSFDGQVPGWTGHVRETVAITASDATVYDPPLKVVRCLTAGNLVFALDKDNVVATAKAMAAGDETTFYAIKRVMAASTGTYEGYR